MSFGSYLSFWSWRVGLCVLPLLRGCSILTGGDLSNQEPAPKMPAGLATCQRFLSTRSAGLLDRNRSHRVTETAKRLTRLLMHPGRSIENPSRRTRPNHHYSRGTCVWRRIHRSAQYFSVHGRFCRVEFTRSVQKGYPPSHQRPGHAASFFAAEIRDKCSVKYGRFRPITIE